MSVPATSVPAASRRRPRRARSEPEAAANLLRQARHGLVEADHLPQATDRYAGAQLAALRAAAAVLAARAKRRRTRQPTDAWVLLARVCPELAEWATFFAACSRTRAAAEAGVTRLVTPRAADDLVRQAGEFLVLAERIVCGARQ